MENQLKPDRKWDDIVTLPYSEFVAAIGQPNSPPGGERTIDFWVSHAHFNSASVLLDLACNTGFTARSVVNKVGCKAFGVDISELCVKMAEKISILEPLSANMSFKRMNAASLQYSDNHFTHITAGCSFAFIQMRNAALSESFRVLTNGGFLCVANFFYHHTPPEDLIYQVSQIVGFRPSLEWTCGWWNNFFSSRFEKYNEVISDLSVIDEHQIEEGVRNFIYFQSSITQATNRIKEECTQRLVSIRTLLNEHRRFQKYAITVWKKGNAVSFD